MAGRTEERTKMKEGWLGDRDAGHAEYQAKTQTGSGAVRGNRDNLEKNSRKEEQRQKEEICVDRVKGVGGGREEKRGNCEGELQELRKVTKNVIIFLKG